MKTLPTLGYIAAVAAVALGACSKKPDRDALQCPPDTVRAAYANRQFFSHDVVAGQTPARALASHKGLIRKATLSKAGETTLDVPFYLTGWTNCAWLAGWESLTPVVVKDGVIMGYGTETVKDLIAQGWVLKEATWPWQDYSFGYLPQK